jgi:predicted adenylyl cyclase CyaB
MSINIEIKAKAADPANLRRILERLGAAPGEMILQEDIFFHTVKGRLKLRVLSLNDGELIYYERANIAGPKRSHYFITPCTDPTSLRILLSTALGTRGVVRKRRLLYRIRNTRVHLDDVDGLGTFVELEVVMNEGMMSEEGESVAHEIMKQLGICETDWVAEAYIDLLERKPT